MLLDCQNSSLLWACDGADELGSDPLRLDQIPPEHGPVFGPSRAIGAGRCQPTAPTRASCPGHCHRSAASRSRPTQSPLPFVPTVGSRVRPRS